jgi:serine/threonine protein kinase
MSAVYKATDPNLKRVVAIKMIHPHLSDDPDFVKRFEEEAAAVAQLRHPNIIQVFDFNHDAESDSYYMVLEFVPGETLQQHLARLNASGRKLSITKALESMIDICEAVNYAHQRGMIHRDIKPANLMLTVTGQAILMDFGIAKIVGGQRHTATGAVVGTAMYMSPEQIKGEHPDRRSDIYSLGVTLFEMVSGRPPFEADSAMTLMMMHVNDPVPDPRTLNPDVPDDLVTVIDKALAKDPNDRYQTAAQMAAALRNILGRIKAGASLETPVSPGATMVETPDMTPAGKPGATVVEDPGVSFESSGGTYVEPVSTPVESAPGTQVETTPPPPRATGSVAGTGGIGSGGAAIGGSAAEPAPAKGTPTKILGLSLPVIAGAALVLVCLLGGGIFMVSRLFAGPGASPLLPPPATETATATEVVDTPLPSATPTLEITSTPTETPLPSATPTATVPPGIPFARINSITIDDQNRYVVEYETFEFTEKLPGMHVHFFFNTVSPENAGVPGSGPWILYGGPRPFTKYRVSDRPAQATQMCILVANPNHSVQPNSGNCMDLPEPQ